MWNRSYWICKLCCLFLALLVFCGCVPQNTEKEGIEYTDALGRQVILPHNPERVACMIGSFADVWRLAGGEVAATAKDAWDDFGLDLPGAVNIGTIKKPNVELLLSADPDLVIASAGTASNVELLDTLEGAGIPVVCFEIETFSDYLEMLEVCTGLTERPDLYRKNGLEVAAEIEEIKADFAKKNLPDGKKTALLLRISAGYVRAKNSDGNILGGMLRDLGCANIADDDESLLENLSMEAIIQANPHHIFVVQMGNDTQAARESLANMMEENPAWQELDAVAEGRIHEMERRLFNMKPNARWAEAYETLCQVLISS